MAKMLIDTFNDYVMTSLGLCQVAMAVKHKQFTFGQTTFEVISTQQISANASWLQRHTNVTIDLPLCIFSFLLFLDLNFCLSIPLVSFIVK